MSLTLVLSTERQNKVNLSFSSSDEVFVAQSWIKVKLISTVPLFCVDTLNAAFDKLET